MEFEAVDEGIIGKILIEEGTEGVKVNTAIAVLLEDGESMDDAASSPAAAPAAVEAPAAAVASEAPAAPQVDTSPDWPEGTPMRTQTVREALRDGMSEEMRRDDTVFLMGEEVAEYQGAYKISQGMLDEFGPKRVRDTPITEHGFAGIGVGAAFGGLRPIVEFMTFNFAMQAIDHIINSAAKTLYMSGGQMGAPMVFRGPNGAAARVGAQHSQDYAAWYMQIPGLKVAMPYSASDYKGLMKTAIRDPNPVIFLENEILYGRTFDVPDMDDYTVPFGKARVWREGDDCTIVSFGIGMQYALAAAEKLAEEGIDCDVIDLRTLRPMDTGAILNSVMKTNRCVTVEEGWPQGSVGNYITSVIMQEAFDYLDAPVINCTGKDVPMPYAANLEKHALLTTDEVVAAVKNVTYR
jgi:pyruvate dehydrogenase E1 component beta subunit